MAQHKCAAAVSRPSPPIKAALQQSIPSIGWPMLHSVSPKCMGIPANALPANTSKSTRDVIRILMVSHTLWNSRDACQDTLSSATWSSHILARQGPPRSVSQGSYLAKISGFRGESGAASEGSSQKSQPLRIIPQQLVSRPLAKAGVRRHTNTEPGAAATGSETQLSKHILNRIFVRNG
jgi:hypothetical protein